LSQARYGISAILLACIIWGFVPIYFKLLLHVPPIELLAHRTLWSFLFFFAVLFFNGKIKELRDAVFVSKESRSTIMTSALLIAINWFFFIFAVQSNNITETSLGYFIMPLFTVIWGLIIFKEKLSNAQWVAVLLAASAVLILTIGLAKAPLIALILGLSFSYYAVLKKKLLISPMVSVTGEVLILVPLAIIVIIYFHLGQGSSFGKSFYTSFLFVLSGPLTAVPLILFSYGTLRVALSTAGILQYLNPSLQFFCAVILFLEPLTMWHIVSFPMIWIALAIYSWVGIKHSNQT
jgi:chloramphenicol-sensitive protein RarD